MTAGGPKALLPPAGLPQQQDRYLVFFRKFAMHKMQVRVDDDTRMEAHTHTNPRTCCHPPAILVYPLLPLSCFTRPPPA